MRNILSSLLGKVAWEKPYWLSRLLARVENNPKKTWSHLLIFLLLIALMISGFWFYQKMPKPQELTATLTLRPIKIFDQKQLPEPLVIGFIDKSYDTHYHLSVAPLSKINTTITKDIKIYPEISGNWKWQDDKSLEFLPSKPWPAGQEYTVYFSKGLFNKSYRMSTWHSTFSTTPLFIKIQDFKFFQDILHPTTYKVSANITYNYPIDTESLKRKIKLSYPETGEPLSYTLLFDPNSQQTYLTADVTLLPEKARYLNLTINKGIKPKEEGNVTTEEVTARLMIPDRNSIVRINNAAARIVQNNKGQPEQVLTIETSVGVSSEALQKSLHVYLLPQEYPALGTMPAQKNFQWTSPAQVNQSMLSQPIEITPIPTVYNYETLHSFKIHIRPTAYLYVSIDKGLSSIGDYTLAFPYTAIVQAPEYPKEIKFLHEGSLLALSGEKKLSIICRGIPTVKFTVARVLPDEINHLITQTSGDFQNPTFINDSFNASDISIFHSDIKTFDVSDESKAQYMSLDFSKYLDNQPIKLGLFLIKAESWDPTNSTSTGIVSSRLVLITDLDILAKHNSDDSQDVFVQSITTGMPVANTHLEVLGRNGLAITTQTTDEKGHVHFPSLKDFIDDKAPTVYRVIKDNDISFMPFYSQNRSLNYSRFDTGGVDTPTNKYGLNAFLFSERGIYRPGDKVHLGMIIKGNYASKTSVDLPLELIITDPRGMVALDKKFISSNDGYMTEDYQTSLTALTGQYTASLYITKDGSSDDLLGSTTLQVQEFQPDQLKLAVHFEPKPNIPEGWVSPMNLTAKIQLLNLFGTPATHRRVTGKLIFTPQTLKFNAYPDFIFSDPYRDPSKPEKVFTESLTDTYTDNHGNAEFILDLHRYAQSTYQLTLETQGFAAEGGRGVTKDSTILVSPMQTLIGYKTDGDLNYIRQNDKRSVHFIAINSELQQVSIENLNLKLVQLNTITTLTKQADGSYQYQTVTEEKELNTLPFPITDSGYDFQLPTEHIGDYKIKITESNGLLLSQFSFSIIGKGEQAIPKNSTLNLKLNKENYNPGESIQLNITSPFTGYGLISIERDKVYAFKWFKMDTTSTVESITIPPDFEGSGYVNVALIRDWNAPEIFMNPLSYAVQPFSVVPDSRRMNIQLTIPDHAYPGEPLKIAYSSNQPGKIIVYAVDEGILHLTHYNTPDPLGYYFSKQALKVDTHQIADEILPKFIENRELSAIGGDSENAAAAAALSSNLNPFARKVQPIVFWSGILNTDNQTHQILYNVPDYFNGTLRVMAVAVSPDAVGSNEKAALIRNDCILTPNLPTFIAPNDQFEVSLSVANTTKDSNPVKVAIMPSENFQVLGSSEEMLTINPGAEKTALFKLKANGKLGDTLVNFSATVNNKTFKQKANISIRPITPYRTTLMSGYATTDKDFLLTRKMLPELQTSKALSSTNPFILIMGLKNYLDSYPYDCTEQLISKAFVQLALKDQPLPNEHDQLRDPEKLTAAYNTIIQMLRQRQTNNGSFVYWPNGASTDAFISIYVTDFLTEAKSLGYEVPTDMFNNAINYLKYFVGTDPTSFNDARHHAYAIYILTQNDIITTDYIANLQAYFQQINNNHWQEDITGAYLAGAYKILQNNDLADHLIAQYKMDETVNYNDTFYDPVTTDTQTISILAKYFPDRLKQIQSTHLMKLVENLSTDRVDSLNAAMSARALSAISKVNPQNSDSKLSISSTNDKHEELSIDNNTLNPAATTVHFKTLDQIGYFYQVMQSGFDLTAPITALANEVNSGIEVYREYQDSHGTATTTVNLGDTLEVHVRVRSASNQAINNVAIVDLLPAGFELVSNSVHPLESKLIYLDYYDAREDRIVLYLTATQDLREYVYQIKATSRGTFAIPPIFANAMYNPQILAEGKEGVMEVS